MRSAQYRICITLSILILASEYCIAQNSLKLPFTYKLNSSTGLSSYNANKILQDKFGFVWIATQDGLNRYDGREFVVYSKSSPPKRRLLGNVINTMIIDSVKNVLWVTTSYGGVNGVDLVSGDVIHALPAKIDWLKCMRVCMNNLWIGTLEGFKVYDPEANTFYNTDPLPWKDSLNVTFVLPDRFNNVWIFLPDRGLAIYSGTSRKLIGSYDNKYLNIKETFGHLQFTSRLVHMSDTSFLWANDHGFRIIYFNRAGKITRIDSTLRINEHFGKEVIFACAMDKFQRLWFATSDALYVADIHTGSWQRVHDIAANSQSSWLQHIYNIFFDSKDNVWIGSQNGAAYAKYRPPPFMPYYEDVVSKLRLSHVNYMLPASENTLYVASQDGFYHLNLTTDRLLRIDSGVYNYIFENNDGNLILSSDDGLFVMDARKIISPAQNIYKELDSIAADPVNATIILTGSLLLMSSEANNGRVYIWNRSTHKIRTVEMITDSVSNPIINTTYRDRQNRIWVLFDNAIALLNTKDYSFRKFQIQDQELKIPLSLLFDVCELGNDYWLAVYGKGVVQLDADLNVIKVYSFAEGLTNTGVYKVMPYADSVIFASTNNGIFSINTKSGKVIQYLKGDGLNTNAFEEHSGFVYGNTLFAGGVEGLTKIEPANIVRDDELPELYINKVEMEWKEHIIDTFGLQLEHVVVPNYILQTTVYFSALEFTNRAKLSFSYRVQEINKDWIRLDQRNFVDLTGYSPGTYTLEIRISNGTISNVKQIKVTFRPKWYQTVLFKIAVALAVLAIFYAVYRYRLQQRRKQQQIRKGIASDLHDDIGSTLNSVKVFTHLAKRNPDKTEYMDQIEEMLVQATAGLRDMIWVLEDSKETIHELVERIRKFTIPVTSANGINLECSVETSQNNKQLSRAEKRNLLLIAKESINNSLKYAECQNIFLSVRQTDGKMSLTIRDDGKGFDQSIPSYGNGLKNIHYRANQIHYSVTITSSAGKGTTITLEKTR